MKPYQPYQQGHYARPVRSPLRVLRIFRRRDQTRGCKSQARARSGASRVKLRRFLAPRAGLRAMLIRVRCAYDPQPKVNMIRDSLRVLGEVLSSRLELAPGPVSPPAGAAIGRSRWHLALLAPSGVSPVRPGPSSIRLLVASDSYVIEWKDQARTVQ
jgi:hypothetical protein